MTDSDLEPRRIMLVHDDVSRRLDEMADLCEHWKRWREGREYTPRAIRAALIMLSHDVATLASLEKAHGPRMEEVSSRLGVPRTRSDGLASEMMDSQDPSGSPTSRKMDE